MDIDFIDQNLLLPYKLLGLSNRNVAIWPG